MRFGKSAFLTAPENTPTTRSDSSIAARRFSRIGKRQDLNGAEPGFHQRGPTGNRKFCSAKSIPMSTLRVQMHLRGNLGVLQSQKINGRIFDMHGIVLRLHDERWWSPLRRMDVRIARKVLLRNRQVARI